MKLDPEVLAAVKAIQLTHETLMGDGRPDNAEELVTQWTREAGGAAEMIAGLLTAGAILADCVAQALDDPVETVFAEILEYEG